MTLCTANLFVECHPRGDDVTSTDDHFALVSRNHSRHWIRTSLAVISQIETTECVRIDAAIRLLGIRALLGCELILAQRSAWVIFEETVDVVYGKTPTIWCCSLTARNELGIDERQSNRTLHLNSKTF